MQQPVLPVLPQLAWTLYSCNELVPHWEMEQDGSLELRLVQLLMPALPALAVALRLPAERRPPGCSWETADYILAALTIPPLRPARNGWFAAADSRSLLSTVCAIAQLLAILPLEQPAADTVAPAGSSAGSPATALPRHTGAASFLECSFMMAMNALAVLASSARCAEQALSQQSLQEQRRLASSLLPVLARLPSLAALASSPTIAVGWPSNTAADAQVNLIVSVCTLIWLLLAVGSKSGAATAYGDGTPRLVSSFADAAAWCSAASAALRAIPLLAAWQVPAINLVQSLVELASWAGPAARFLTGRRNVARQMAAAGGAAASAAPAAPAAAEDTAPLLEAVWDLHTQAARLVHFVASGGSGATLRFVDHPQAMASLLNALSNSISAAYQASEAPASATGGPLEERTSRCSGGLCAGVRRSQCSCDRMHMLCMNCT